MKFLPNPIGDNYLEPFAVSDRLELAEQIRNCEILPYDVFTQVQYKKFIKLVREERNL